MLTGLPPVRLSARINTFPWGSSFAPGCPASPPFPLPGPSKVSFGVPRSQSPPVGLLVSNTMTWSGRPSRPSPRICTPQSLHCSLTHVPATSGLPAASNSKSIGPAGHTSTTGVLVGGTGVLVAVGKGVLVGTLVGSGVVVGSSPIVKLMTTGPHSQYPKLLEP